MEDGTVADGEGGGFTGFVVAVVSDCGHGSDASVVVWSEADGPRGHSEEIEHGGMFGLMATRSFPQVIRDVVLKGSGE